MNDRLSTWESLRLPGRLTPGIPGGGGGGGGRGRGGAGKTTNSGLEKTFFLTQLIHTERLNARKHRLTVKR